MDSPTSDGGTPSQAFRIGRAWADVRRLADGTEVSVRMLRPEDREAFLAGFRHLSPQSRYFRFFSATPRLPERVLAQLLHPDGVDHVALAAWRSARGELIEPIGVARFVRLDGGDTADVAITVVDDMQAHGVGRLLFAHLSEAARERGIRRFRAEVLVDNRGISALLHDVEPNAKPVARDGNVAVYELDVAPATAGRG